MESGVKVIACLDIGVDSCEPDFGLLKIHLSWVRESC
jgi:hypothetical protein